MECLNRIFALSTRPEGKEGILLTLPLSQEPGFHSTILEGDRGSWWSTWYPGWTLQGLLLGVCVVHRRILPYQNQRPDRRDEKNRGAYQTRYCFHSVFVELISTWNWWVLGSAPTSYVSSVKVLTRFLKMFAFWECLDWISSSRLRRYERFETMTAHPWSIRTLRVTTDMMRDLEVVGEPRRQWASGSREKYKSPRDLRRVDT